MPEAAASGPAIGRTIHRRSIATTVLGFTAVIAALPVVTVGALAWRSASAPMQEAFGGELSRAASLAAQGVERQISTRAAQLELWAGLGVMQEIVTDDADANLATFLARAAAVEPVIERLAVYDATGGLVAGSRADVPPSIGAATRARAALDGARTLELLRGEDGVLEMAAPVRTREKAGRVIGVLVARLRRDLLVSPLRELASAGDKGGVAAIADRGGVVLLGVQVEAGTRLDERFPAAASRLAARGAGWVAEDRVGVMAGEVVGYASLGGDGDGRATGWTILVAAPAGQVFAPIDRFRELLLIACVITGFVVMGVGLVLSRRVVGPILRLTDTVDEIHRTGELSRRATVEGGAEIARLAQALNSFTSELAEARARLLADARTLDAKNKQLEAANLYRARFFAMISHELRTPLHGIIGFTDLVLAAERGHLSAQSAANLENALAAAENLVGIVTNLLDLTKAEAGALKVRPAELALPSILEQCAASARAIVRDRPVAIVVEVVGALPPMYSDALLIRQIVTNLVGNAVKFTERGEVRLRASLTFDDKVRIEVQDTGPGIPPDQVGRIFEEFYQVDGGDTRRHGGTGLGLAVVKTFTQLLGGKVLVESKLGRGTTFTVTLPLGRVTAPIPVLSA